MTIGLRQGSLFLCGLFCILLASCGGGGASSGGLSTGGNSSGTSGSTGGTGGSSSARNVSLDFISPSKATVGNGIGLLGLYGQNFSNNSSVLFDGQPGQVFGQSSTYLELQIPSLVIGVAGKHTVQVKDPVGGSSAILIYDVYVPQPGPLNFNGQPRFNPVPNMAGHGTLADVNGDGLSDLITVSPQNGTNPPQLTVAFGQKDGTLSEPVSANFALSKGLPAQVLAGDFNGDGKIDLILNYGSSYEALLNDGSGHFTAAGSGTIPGAGWGRGTIGDFNGDGKLDFAIDTGQVPTIAIFFGNGDGTFGLASLLGANHPNKVAILMAADLNRDGITDLICADYAASSSVVPDSLELHTLIFHRDGSATDTLTTTPYQYPWSAALGDFNNDQIPDLFVVDAVSGNGQALAGNGDGTFSPLGTPVFASDGFLVTPPFVTGDFDHDGNLDLATRLTLVGPDVIQFMWGDGHGNFTDQIIASDQSFSLTTGDINGDGVPDILEGYGFNLPGAILGRNDRNFPTPKLLLNAPQGALSAGNVFNDGYHDILVSGYGDCTTNSGPTGTIYHFLPNNAPTAKATTPACPSVLVDLDGDGIADLVGYAGNTNTVFIWKGDGAGNFLGPITKIPINGFHVIQEFKFRDMDGDGHMDIVVAGQILYGKGNFQFDIVPVPDLAPTGNQGFVVGDFDGDGIPDILFADGVLFGQGNRTFSTPTGAATVPPCWEGSYLQYPAVGDLNGDGKDDVVCGTSVDLYLSTGRSGFLLDQALAIPSGILETANIADLNADGKADIIIGLGSGPDDVVVFTNNGQGEYQITTYAVGVNPIGSLVSDFNRDGAPDIALINFVYDYKRPAVEVLLHK